MCRMKTVIEENPGFDVEEGDTVSMQNGIVCSKHSYTISKPLSISFRWNRLSIWGRMSSNLTKDSSTVERLYNQT